MTLISNGVRKRGTGFAYHGMAGNVGIAGGPLATALLLLAFDWRTVAGILAVPAVLAAGAGLTREFDPAAAIDSGESGRRHGIPVSLAAFVTETRSLLTAGSVVVLLLAAFNGLYYRGL